MKIKMTRNLWLKLGSLVIAFFVWLGVVNVANPSKIATREVPVEIMNAQILERSNMTYEVVGKKTATVSFKIRTKDDYKINASDFRAYADLTEMYDVTGAIPIKVEILNHKSLLESAPVVKAPEVIKIKTENLQVKEFTLNAYPLGKPAEGYQAGTVSMAPVHVSVRGPVSQIGQINHVGIRFSVEGATADVSGTAVPIYFDSNGNSLDFGDSVKTLSGNISYTMSVLKVKNVPLDFVVSGEVAEGYRYTGPETAIRSVSVAGLKSDLAEVNTITVQSPSLSVQGATEDVVCTVDLTQYIDSSLTIAGLEDSVIDVILKVEPLKEQEFTIDSDDILFENQEAGLDYSMEETNVLLTVLGLRDDLDSLSPDKMKLTADVAGLKAGEHSVQLQMELEDAFEVPSVPEITVIVTRGSDDEDAESGSEKKEEETGKKEAETETPQKKNPDKKKN